jgi:hypothetical protein
MKLILIAKETNQVIDTVEADFLPEAGEIIVYKDLEPEEKLYQVEKYLKPTLFKDGVKQYKTVVSAYAGQSFRR